MGLSFDVSSCSPGLGQAIAALSSVAGGNEEHPLDANQRAQRQVIEAAAESAELKKALLAELQSAHERAQEQGRCLQQENDLIEERLRYLLRLRSESLEEALLQICSRFCASLERERDTAIRKLSELTDDYEREEAAGSLAQYLRFLALHLQDETGGDVRLQALDKDGTEFSRCCQGVASSVKEGFFDGSLHDAYAVSDVFRLSNAFLRERFQAASAGRDVKVKGLFASLAVQSVESTAVYGVSHLIRAEAVERCRKPWTLGPALRESHQRIRTLLAASDLPPLPMRFSRHSTLSSDLESLGPSSSAHAGSSKPNANPAARDQAERSSADRVRCLLLSRVILPADPQSLRRMQDAQTGELLIHDGWRVMPEYFIFYTLRPRKKPSGEDLGTEEDEDEEINEDDTEDEEPAVPATCPSEVQHGQTVLAAGGLRKLRPFSAPIYKTQPLPSQPRKFRPVSAVRQGAGPSRKDVDSVPEAGLDPRRLDSRAQKSRQHLLSIIQTELQGFMHGCAADKQRSLSLRR